MSQHVLKKPVLDLAVVENKIKRRLQQEKIRFLLFHILCLIMAIIVIFFIV